MAFANYRHYINAEFHKQVRIHLDMDTDYDYYGELISADEPRVVKGLMLTMNKFISTHLPAGDTRKSRAGAISRGMASSLAHILILYPTRNEPYTVTSLGKYLDDINTTVHPLVGVA